MTTLVAENFYNDVFADQNIRLYTSQYFKAVRLHIFKNGTLSYSNLILKIMDGEQEIARKIISHNDINTNLTGTYWHGMITFEFDEAIFMTVYPTEEYHEYTLRFYLTDFDGDPNELWYCRNYDRTTLNTSTDFKFPLLYGVGTTDGYTCEFANMNPIWVEIYTLS